MCKVDVVKKHWLISLFVVYGVSYWFNLLVGMTQLHEPANLPGLLVLISVMSVFYVGSMLLLYYCSYRKAGTRLLIFALIMIPCGFIKMFGRVFDHTIKPGNFNPVCGLVLLTNFLLCLYFWINCYHLYKVNKTKRLQSSPNCAE